MAGVKLVMCQLILVDVFPLILNEDQLIVSYGLPADLDEELLPVCSICSK